MARLPGQRGEFGGWLERERTRRYKTQTDALRAFERLAGLKISPSEYAQWESGSRVPKADNPKVARLYEFFGSQPEPTEPVLSGTGDLAALVAALARQTAAIERQNELRERELEIQASQAASLATLADEMNRLYMAQVEMFGALAHSDVADGRPPRERARGGRQSSTHPEDRADRPAPTPNGKGAR